MDADIAAVLAGERRWTVVEGDCRTVLADLPDACISACVCDPPYEIGFMGSKWDRSGVAFDPATWAHVLRVLKPGGHLLAFGGTRTYHRMACAIEDAGFEIRDCLQWVYGSGFPKSLDVSKAIDAAAGAEREVGVGAGTAPAIEVPVTAPATPEAQQWNGYGTALKPANEPIVLARKPLAGTVAANVLEHGTGALNVDGCRVPTDWQEPDRPDSWKRSGHTADAEADKIAAPPGNGIECHPGGRWPPNVLLSHDPRCNGECVDGCPVRLLDEQSGERTSGFMPAGTVRATRTGYSGHMPHATAHDTIADSGTASRFFPRFRYCAKASTAEREAGLAHLPALQRDEARDPDAPGANNPRNRGGNLRRNTHPTVKPIDLMRWLVRLVTPPGGVVLDPFAGSGSTGCAAMIEGVRFVGIELDARHVEIARGRIAHVEANPGKPLGGEPAQKADPRQLSLLGGQS